jgi:PncC family amidohydrolase
MTPEVYSPAQLELLQNLADRLRASGQSVGVAESLTGGRVAAALTWLAGSSDYFQGGVLAYSNRLKRELLGVPEDILTGYGAVSEPCARAMAEGARLKLGVTAALATTGIAGPGGGSPGKPVGLVWLAVVTGRGVFTDRRQFAGDREAITKASVEAALNLLFTCL